ncbi:hypothetical protein GN956_G24787 [Arapaima gigas]
MPSCAALCFNPVRRFPAGSAAPGPRRVAGSLSGPGERRSPLRRVSVERRFQLAPAVVENAQRSGNRNTLRSPATWPGLESTSAPNPHRRTTARPLLASPVLLWLLQGIEPSCRRCPWVLPVGLCSAALVSCLLCAECNQKRCGSGEQRQGRSIRRRETESD